MTTAGMDSRRNRIARRLANAALRLATPEYRAMIDGAIRYGLRSAALDADGDYWIVRRGDALVRERRSGSDGAQPCGWCHGEGALRDPDGKLGEDCPRCHGRSRLDPAVSKEQRRD